MPPSQQTARINLQDLKAKLSKILGPDKESQYFSIFSRFLSHRLTKSELDRQVVLTIGKENIALHNQIVKAILYNATCAEPPLPPAVNDNTSKPVKGIRRKPLTPSANNDEPFSLSQLPSASAAQAIRSNGDAILMSPRKGRSGIRDRKAKERQSLLGLNVKEEASTSQGDTEDAGTRTQPGRAEIDLLRPVQQLQGVAEQPDVDSISSVTLSLKRPRLILPSQVESPAFDSRGALSLTEEAVEDQECILWNGSPVRAPLGIPFCVGSIGAAQRAPFASKPGVLIHTLLGDSIEEECLEASDLPDGDGMLKRMEQIAVLEEGLQGVSHECANLLNQALDVYLKRLIAASLGLVQSRRKRDGDRQPYCKDPGSLDLRKDGVSPSKLSHGLNGVWPSSHMQASAAGLSAEFEAADRRQCAPVSALDFKVAMDANPQLLGENRPIHLERIMLRVFERQQQQVLQ